MQSTNPEQLLRRETTKKSRQQDVEDEIEVEPVRELTELEVKQMLSEYRAIADLDDAECTPWQRQLRVNKMMLE